MRSLLVFIILVAGAAACGAQFQPGAWYGSLDKPPWTPPGWLFGPVWSVLYLAIAVAGWLVWRDCSTGARPARVALVLWSAQLGLNTIWSWLFFGLKRPAWALIDIVLLLATILAFVGVTWSRPRVAALLFLPYALWVAFATALNGAISRLNP